MKHRLLLAVLLALTGGIFLAIAYVKPYGGSFLLSELVLQLSGSSGTIPLGFSMPELVAFMMRMLPGFIFEICFGTMIYRHFCTASIYVFSRYPKRLRWYYGETFLLAVTNSLYQIILLMTVVGITALRYSFTCDGPGLFLLFCHFILHTLWLYAMTLSINLLAIWTGSNRAFVIVTGLQIICITLLGSVAALQKQLNEVLLPEILMKLNPVTHLILGWHSSNNQTINQTLNSPYPGIYLHHSVLLMLIISSAILLLGGIFVSRHDLLISDSEMEVS